MQRALNAKTMKILKLTNATIIGVNITGISQGADVAVHDKSINGLANLTASGTIAKKITTPNTLRTSGAGINITSDRALFRGLDNSIYMDAHPRGVLFYVDVYTDTFLKVQNGFSIGT
jgi:hypothetical protein